MKTSKTTTCQITRNKEHVVWLKSKKKRLDGTMELIYHCYDCNLGFKVLIENKNSHK